MLFYVGLILGLISSAVLTVNSVDPWTAIVVGSMLPILGACAGWGLRVALNWYNGWAFD